MVLRGEAGAGLLSSYHAERQPVGARVVERAMKSVQDMLPISQALGFRAGQSSDEGWATLRELFSDTDTGRARRDALTRAVELQNYQFNAHGVELGQQYTSDAVVDDGARQPDPERDADLHYQPTTLPGARLPHAWVQHADRLVSTLDLAGHGRFSLLVGIGGEPWRDAAAKVAAELGLEIVVRSVGHRCEYDDVLGHWTKLREIGDRGCLLVRPDQHIAYRSADLPDQPLDTLRQALEHVLALPTH